MPETACSQAVPAGTSACQLADVFGRYGEAYQRRHILSPTQQKVVVHR